MRKLLFVLALAACSTPPQTRSASGYTAKVLDLPAGALYSAAYSINDSGVTAGRGYTPKFFAVKWTRDGAAIVLPKIPDQVSSTANDINNAGIIVGSANDNKRHIHPLIWAGDSIIYLPDLGEGGAATGISDSGVINGYVWVGGKMHAARWDNGVVRDINPAGYVTSRARDVNELRDFVGWVFNGTDTMAYTWKADGSQHPLGLFPGTVGSDVHSSNNVGMILGQTTDGTGPEALIWTSPNGFQKAGFGGENSIAYVATDKGRVVGWSSTAKTAPIALTLLGGVLDSLPNPLGGAGWAYDVNSCGMITGQAQGGRDIKSRRAITWSKPTCD